MAEVSEYAKHLGKKPTVIEAFVVCPDTRTIDGSSGAWGNIEY